MQQCITGEVSRVQAVMCWRPVCGQQALGWLFVRSKKIKKEQREKSGAKKGVHGGGKELHPTEVETMCENHRGVQRVQQHERREVNSLARKIPHLLHHAPAYL